MDEKIKWKYRRDKIFSYFFLAGVCLGIGYALTGIIDSIP